VGEDSTRGNNAASNREDAAHAGWVTTQVAARSLAISPRTVRWHIEQGHIEAKPQGEGVRRSWLVSIDSLQAFRDARQRQGQSPGGFREAQKSADIAAQPPGNPIRELADRLVEEASRASEFRVRFEISEKAASTLREELSEERRRREEAERERNDLRQELYALREATEASETVEGELERAESQPAASGSGSFKRLSVWVYGLGAILTGMTGFLMQLDLGYQIFQPLGLGLPNDVVFRYGVGWGLPLLLPIIFGYQVGRKPRGTNFWRHVGITALLAALVSFLPWAILIVPQTGTGLLTSNEVSTIFFEATQMWLPVGLAFLSSALIGNARRRRVAGPTP
jgi:Helix-turn-helix domain